MFSNCLLIIPNNVFFLCSSNMNDVSLLIIVFSSKFSFLENSSNLSISSYLYLRYFSIEISILSKSMIASKDNLPSFIKKIFSKNSPSPTRTIFFFEDIGIKCVKTFKIKSELSQCLKKVNLLISFLCISKRTEFCKV